MGEAHIDKRTAGKNGGCLSRKEQDRKGKTSQGRTRQSQGNGWATHCKGVVPEETKRSSGRHYVRNVSGKERLGIIWTEETKVKKKPVHHQQKTKQTSVGEEGITGVRNQGSGWERGRRFKNFWRGETSITILPEFCGGRHLRSL